MALFRACRDGTVKIDARLVRKKKKLNQNLMSIRLVDS